MTGAPLLNKVDVCKPAIEGVNLFERNEFANLRAFNCSTQPVAGIVYRVGLRRAKENKMYCVVSIFADFGGSYEIQPDDSDRLDCAVVFAKSGSRNK